MRHRRYVNSSVRFILISLLLSLCASAAADSGKRRCRLAQIWTSADALYALAVNVDLGGAVTSPVSCQLLIGGELTGVPVTGVAASPPVELRVVLAVQTSASYEPAAEELKSALHAFLMQLPARSRVHLITFSDAKKTHASAGFGDHATAAAAIAGMSLDGEQEPLLAEALRAGMDALDAAREAGTADEPGRPRQLMVVVSDGMNPRLERSVFRNLGKELARREVPLFPIAYSAQDLRSPLRNLGELARRSGGTFRWARDKMALTVQLESLARELQSVSQFKFALPSPPMPTAEEYAISLRCKESLTSNVLLLPAHALRPRSRPLSYAGLVLGLVMLAGLSALLLRRQRTRHARRTAEVVPTHWLIFVKGPLAGQRFALRDSLSIGRAPKDRSGIVIFDSSLADNHCVLTADHTGVWLDLLRAGGASCDGAAVSGKQRLPDGSIVRLGDDTEFVLRRAGGERAGL